MQSAFRPIRASDCVVHVLTFATYRQCPGGRSRLAALRLANGSTAMDFSGIAASVGDTE
jgi:hypothetical protein